MFVQSITSSINMWSSVSTCILMKCTSCCFRLYLVGIITISHELSAEILIVQKFSSVFAPNDGIWENRKNGKHSLKSLLLFNGLSGENYSLLDMEQNYVGYHHLAFPMTAKVILTEILNFLTSERWWWHLHVFVIAPVISARPCMKSCSYYLHEEWKPCWSMIKSLIKASNSLKNNQFLDQKVRFTIESSRGRRF